MRGRSLKEENRLLKAALAKLMQGHEAEVLFCSVAILDAEAQPTCLVQDCMFFVIAAGAEDRLAGKTATIETVQ